MTRSYWKQFVPTFIISLSAIGLCAASVAAAPPSGQFLRPVRPGGFQPGPQFPGVISLGVGPRFVPSMNAGLGHLNLTGPVFTPGSFMNNVPNNPGVGASFNAFSNPFLSTRSLPSFSGFGYGMSTMYNNAGIGPTAAPMMSTMPGYGYPANSTLSITGNYNDLTQPSQNNALNRLLVEQALENKDTNQALRAVGVRAEGGQLNWPLGLQVLYPTTENDELRQQIDAAFQIVAKQGAQGQANPELVKGAAQKVSKLRGLLHNRQGFLQARTYKEAAEFLDKLDQALTLLLPNQQQSAKQDR